VGFLDIPASGWIGMMIDIEENQGRRRNIERLRILSYKCF